MARYIQNGRLCDYAAHQNRILDRKIKNREACAACGRTFKPHVREPDQHDPTLCTECKASL